MRQGRVREEGPRAEEKGSLEGPMVSFVGDGLRPVAVPGCIAVIIFSHVPVGMYETSLR